MYIPHTTTATARAQVYRDAQFRVASKIITADVIHCPADEWALRPEARDRDWRPLAFEDWVVAVRLTG